ncbi:MAG: dTDP-4-dehydrorhamnose 3,5-epimerase [Candidatus Latescibacterota bacterium]|nr:dTDP-4-dehydrorhamnose 3,5-epimerase [Candidatus Latescibacterota bacterium]
MSDHLRESDTVAGVLVGDLEVFSDDRGDSAELFRSEWFPSQTWEQIQSNRSHSRAGVLRGLHFHHKQTDYWHFMAGRLRVGLYDLRPDSPTHGRGEVLEFSGDEFRGLFIPPGVAHGYYAVTDAVLLYVVDQFYSGEDEYGLAWNDPELGLDWGESGPPILSERDAANPTLAALPAEELP